MTLNPKTFNNTVMTCLVAKQNYPLAKSFLDYLRSSSNNKPSTLLLAQYMALCSDEAELLSCYDAIKGGMAGNLLLDAHTRDAVICGLCKTSLWKESLPLLESEPELCRPTSLSLNAVADAAFKHEDMGVAWDAMQKLTQPPLQIFASSLEACLGACSKLEFEELRLAVLASIMKGSDLFMNTTPRELEDFERFLSKAPPFDVVIDGLNVALKGNANSNGDKARNLLLVVKHYTLVEKRKVLVVGRKHMRKWPRNVMDQVWSHCAYYLTNDLGPGTVVASRDLMRNHRYKLHEDSRMGGLFDKWRRTHQEVLDVNWGKLSVLKPARHQISVQGSNAKGWHIPYDDGSKLEPYDIRTTWLCLKTREESVWHAADPRQCSASTK
ncbi:hypothetical protein HPB47_020238 [Ixodes persulcatus]|uniref:Uncharacterized protein n=1 Tax=Ixodes persulcatus TaxID=34615 RepID=A0AC60QFW3_IXOPE|nr:hypothetical protein HPB47_020238 [Ixodes persulcatus]